MADATQRRGRTALALGGSLAVTLAVFLAAEIGVRVAGVQPRPWPSADNLLEMPGVMVDPLLGALPEPGWDGAWFGTFAARFDAHGFRETGLPAPPQADTRVVFIGDSCTFGWGVDTPNTFVAQLDALQRRPGPAHLALANAAYQGHSAVVGEYNLRERVLPLKPDIVVLGFSGNNAFRFSVVADAARFRFFGVRKALLRSRLFHIAAAWLAQRTAPGYQPRDRAAVNSAPLPALYRVADAGEYGGALRAMIAEARAAGARPVLLLLPRAANVTAKTGGEDAAVSVQQKPLLPRIEGHPTPREILMLELSCLDHRQLTDPVATMREEIGKWRPVYPAEPALRAALREAAALYSRGDYGTAHERFAAIVAASPDSPLARYDLGVSLLAAGDAASGLSALAEADRLACNVFLHYQVIAWRLAQELGVPVIDATLTFQAHDGEPLYVDAAHPNSAGNRLIAEALLPALSALRGS